MAKSHETCLEEQLKNEKKRSLKYKQWLSWIGATILVGVFFWLTPYVGMELSFVIFFIGLLLLVGIFDPDQIII